jgi:hypothetical protein
MIESRLTPCSACGQKIIDATAQVCSERCANSLSTLATLQDNIRAHVPNDDPRIFFYDIGFGELCDKYSVLVLRYNFQKNLDQQLETKYLMDRLYQSILTKINKSGQHPKTRESITSLIGSLHRINSTMWRLRQETRKDYKYPEDHRKASALEYFEMSEKRDLYRAQLDAMVEGRVRTVRVWL